MTWSALTTASSASGSTSATSAAVSPTALAVSRATGSRISRSARSSGRAARTSSPYRAAVHTQIRSAGSTVAQPVEGLREQAVRAAVRAA